MPILLATKLIPNFHDGNLPKEKRGLLNGLTNLNKNRVNSLVSSNPTLNHKNRPLELKSRLNNNLADQQRIQNELSFNESQAKAARAASDLLEEIKSKKNIKDYKKSTDPRSDNRKLESEFNNIFQASFNGRNLLKNITLTKRLKDFSSESSIGRFNDRNFIKSSLDQINKVKRDAEHRVEELRRDFQDLNIQNANINAVGGKLNGHMQIQSTVNSAKESFLTISAESIRVQANTNLNNTLMHLG